MDTPDPIHTLFVDVLLPLNLDNTFTYRVPQELNEEVVIGKRVTVPFGKKKVMAGIIFDIKETPPERYEAKYLFDVVDNEPIVTEKQLTFWKWVAHYYLCSIGQVYNAAMPAGLKLEATSTLLLDPDLDMDNVTLDEKESIILEALRSSTTLTIEQTASLIGTPHVHKYIRSLYMKGCVLMKEDVTESFKPKTVNVMSIHPHYKDDDHLHGLMDQLEKRAPKQLEALMWMISNVGIDGEVERSILNKNEITANTIRSLLTKEVLLQESKIISRLNFADNVQEPEALEGFQEEAYGSIRTSMDEGKPVLLHGITGSGKTHIYAHLIYQALNSGRQVLYMLPEIALTSQLIDRLEKYFGDRMVVSHSKFSKNERVEVYQRIRGGEATLIVGTRSTIFIPFESLGLIIVDEEHENSFKQHEPAPRFHARDTALYLASRHHIPIVLGSATPAIESYFNAQQGKFALVELNQRFDHAILPSIEVVDMREQKKQKRNKGIFSDTLIDAISSAVEAGKQTILFQNKKGYVPVLECNVCSWTPKCRNCDISLTYYKFQNNMRCHYCGYTESVVHQCAACGNHGIELIGYGTERIEDELKLYLPDIRIGRLDYNTTRHKNAHKKLIRSFDQGELDVLIGTQMIAKGLDFENVSTVGILNADHLINFPDFRANERTFQLLTQVAGRAGRRAEQGKVYIQTSKPDHPVILQIVEQDYRAMYGSEIAEREQFGYPPFTRLVKITMKHKDALQLYKLGQQAQIHLQQIFGSAILGPEKPHVSKIRNLYLLNFVLKMTNDGATIRSEKLRLLRAINELRSNKDFSTVRIVLDVDPI